MHHQCTTVSHLGILDCDGISHLRSHYSIIGIRCVPGFQLHLRGDVMKEMVHGDRGHP